jgi:hypothetical protein
MNHEAIISTALRIDPFGQDGTLYALAVKNPDALTALVAAFVAEEREACAVTCEGISHQASSNAPVLCAMEIRGRSRRDGIKRTQEPARVGGVPEGWVLMPRDLTEDEATYAQGALLDMAWDATTCFVARYTALIRATEQRRAVITATHPKEQP